MKIQLEKSDAGRSALAFKEKNDCTVRAVAHAAQISYDVAHKTLADAGRKNKKGIHLKNHIHAIMKDLNKDCIHVKRSGALSKFVKEFPIGNYIICVRSHAFAVINGVVFDTWEQKAGRQIKQAWRIINNP